jgi:hypothetical protein
VPTGVGALLIDVPVFEPGLLVQLVAEEHSQAFGVAHDERATLGLEDREGPAEDDGGDLMGRVGGDHVDGRPGQEGQSLAHHLLGVAGGGELSALALGLEAQGLGLGDHELFLLGLGHQGLGDVEPGDHEKARFCGGIGRTGDRVHSQVDHVQGAIAPEVPTGRAHRVPGGQGPLAPGPDLLGQIGVGTPPAALPEGPPEHVVANQPASLDRGPIGAHHDPGLVEDAREHEGCFVEGLEPARRELATDREADLKGRTARFGDPNLPSEISRRHAFLLRELAPACCLKPGRRALKA